MEGISREQGAKALQILSNVNTFEVDILKIPI